MGVIKKIKRKKPNKELIEDNYYCVKDDIAEIMLVAEKFVTQVSQIEVNLNERIQKSEIMISELSSEINELKKT